jgi:isopentenyl diphosphate isomerase/L-lactate dehydrogenase-like FMN-dependent dehydrogenase
MLERAHHIADLRELAQRKLPRGLFEFVDRGTEDDRAVRNNRSAFGHFEFVPRVLADVSKRSIATKLLGESCSMPLAIAPTGAAGLLWFEGEIAVARAAKEAGIPFTLSTASIISMERVADEAGGCLWFQLYMWPDRKMSWELVERAKRAGYRALIVTVDTALTPNREYNRKNGFSLPLQVNARNAIDVIQHPAWLAQVFLRYLVTTGMPTLENYPAELKHRLNSAPPNQRILPKNDSLTWSDLKELRARWDGPLLVKGILHPEDAAEALNCGADGIVVSNHGGRNLDFSIAPIDALTPIVERVNGKMDVMVDSGFVRGSDVIKALALGASGVFVGRAPLWGLSVAGKAGVDRALTFFKEEIDRVLGFLGCTSVYQIDPSMIRRV